MTTAFWKAILILPGTALVYVPTLILWLTHGTRYGASFPPDSALQWLAGLLLAGAGFTLGLWSMRLFAAQGEGTPAPWDPIKTFIVTGPYRYMRNPMLTGVILVLGAGAILLQSWGIFVWMVVFFALNTVYFKFSEEPALIKRYGAPYEHYLRHVGRWLPRLTPYEGERSE